MASIHSRAVQQAAAYLGGLEEVAQYLRAPIEDVLRWVRDEEKPPKEVFLRVVDFIIDESPEPRAATESARPTDVRR